MHDFDLLSVLRSFLKACACSHNTYIYRCRSSPIPITICAALREVVNHLGSGRGSQIPGSHYTTQKQISCPSDVALGEVLAETIASKCFCIQQSQGHTVEFFEGYQIAVVCPCRWVRENLTDKANTKICAIPH